MGKLLYRVDEVAKDDIPKQKWGLRAFETRRAFAHNPNLGRKGLRITAESINTSLDKHKIPANEFKSL